MNRNNNVVILGGTGFIGGAVARTLDDNDLPCHRVGQKECDLLECIDVENYLRGFRERSLTIVLAASIKRTTDDSVASMQKNIKMTRNVIRASRNLRVESLVFLSSIDVYGQGEELPLTEESTLFPDSFYGISKMCCEYMLQSACFGSRVTILRLPGVYGRGDKQESVIGRFAGSIVARRGIALSSGGKQVRDYVLADDIGNIVLQLLKRPMPGAFNVVGGKSLGILSIVGLIAGVLGREPKIHKMASGVEERDLVVSNGKLRSLMPSVTFTPMDVGIRKYITEEFSGY